MPDKMNTQPNDPINPSSNSHGLTKREYFTAMAMTGILAAQTQTGFREPKDVSERAVNQADAIIKELNRNSL